MRNGFLLPEESKEPHWGESTLLTWGSSERALQHLFTLLGSKMPGKVEILQLCLPGMSLGRQSILSVRGDGGRSWLPRRASHFSSGSLGKTPNRGSWRFCHQGPSCSYAQGKTGLGALNGSPSPQIVAGNQQAHSRLSQCSDEFIGAASQP